MEAFCTTSAQSEQGLITFVFFAKLREVVTARRHTPEASGFLLGTANMLAARLPLDYDVGVGAWVVAQQIENTLNAAKPWLFDWLQRHE